MVLIMPKPPKISKKVADLEDNEFMINPSGLEEVCYDNE